MISTNADNRPVIDSLEITKEISIAAPIELVFEATLEDLGP